MVSIVLDRFLHGPHHDASNLSNLISILLLSY
jgi:hypothetical protein